MSQKKLFTVCAMAGVVLGMSLAARAGSAVETAGDPLIRLKTGVIDTRVAKPVPLSEGGYFLIRYASLPPVADLLDAGIAPVSYVDSRTIVGYVDPASRSAVDSDGSEDPEWTGRVDPYKKWDQQNPIAPEPTPDAGAVATNGSEDPEAGGRVEPYKKWDQQNPVAPAPTPDAGAVATNGSEDPETGGRLEPYKKWDQENPIAPTPTAESTARSDGAPRMGLVTFYSLVPEAQQLEIIAAAGGTVDQRASLPDFVKLVSAPAASFWALAQQDAVQWLSAAPEHVIGGDRFFYCPGAATDYGYQAEYATNGPGWDGSGLGSAALKYYFDNGTADISSTSEQSALTTAMSRWSAVVQISFSAGSNNGSKTLDIGWYTGSHGDSSAFDGAGGVLAHAYYPAPPNSEPLAGDMHFDDAETWSLSPTSTSQFDLVYVSVHEMGHALGMAHSSVRGAVMYPSASGGNLNDQLATDDINGIRSIYAAK